MSDSLSRQWFAVTNEGLTPLGTCGDFETADEVANALGLETNWIVDPDSAQKWADVMAICGIRGAIQ